MCDNIITILMDACDKNGLYLNIKRHHPRLCRYKETYITPKFNLLRILEFSLHEASRQ
jgi:hypothetical protein